MQELKERNELSMFCFHVKTRDFEREGRFFHGGRKLFGTTLTAFQPLQTYRKLTSYHLSCNLHS